MPRAHVLADPARGTPRPPLISGAAMAHCFARAYRFAKLSNVVILLHEELLGEGDSICRWSERPWMSRRDRVSEVLLCITHSIDALSSRKDGTFGLAPYTHYHAASRVLQPCSAHVRVCEARAQAVHLHALVLQAQLPHASLSDCGERRWRCNSTCTPTCRRPSSRRTPPVTAARS